MTLLPSEALQAADCGPATQALLVKIYLERVRRPPATRRGPQPVPGLEAAGPPAGSATADPPLKGERLESWPPNPPATVPMFAVDSSLLRGSVPGPTATGQVPAGVRSAITLIETRTAEPIGLAQIAAAAQLSPRALQAAFRKHFGTTPLGYLHAVRMARVHADLLAARPGDGQTVSALANRWGFSQLSRFARDYKQRYGVSPRQTLGRSAA